MYDFQSSPYYVSGFFVLSRCVDYCDYRYRSLIANVIVDFKGEVLHVDQREVPGVKLLTGMECYISGHCRKLVGMIDLTYMSIIIFSTSKHVRVCYSIVRCL